MPIKGLRKRLKSFRNRAKAFAADVEKGKGAKMVLRQGKSMEVGLGKHKRLVLKRKLGHMRRAKIDQSRFIKFLAANGIKPKHYSFVRINSNSKLGVQEYFHRPSIASLVDYLEHKAAKSTRYFKGKEDAVLCKQFANQHKNVTVESLERASDEILKHLREADVLFQIPSNIIVVGTARDGKLRFAMVDV